MRKNKYEVIVIAGPTASGKSGKALEIALENDGVIINADSMQIYDALPVLTACPGGDDLAAAPHRLYRFLHPSGNCTAAIWRTLALEEIEAALSAGKQPIVTGGTGFYIKTLIEGLSPVPEIPQEVRAKTLMLHEELGSPAFHEALAERDPEMARRLHTNDTQRLTRAWEVLEATGKSLAVWQDLPKEGPPGHLEFSVIKIVPERKTLHEKINRRFDEMIDKGALDDVRDLMDMVDAGEVSEDAQITNALGYRQLAAFLNRELTLEDAIEKAKAETRQYAKRQITWLRSQVYSHSY